MQLGPACLCPPFWALVHCGPLVPGGSSWLGHAGQLYSRRVWLAPGLWEAADCPVTDVAVSWCKNYCKREASDQLIINEAKSRFLDFIFFAKSFSNCHFPYYTENMQWPWFVFGTFYYFLLASPFVVWLYVLYWLKGINTASGFGLFSQHAFGKGASDCQGGVQRVNAQSLETSSSFVFQNRSEAWGFQVFHSDSIILGLWSINYLTFLLSLLF